MRLIFVPLLLISISLNAQSGRSGTVKFDEVFTFELPYGYSQRDTSGQTILFCHAAYGIITVVKTSPSGVRPNTTDALLRFYRQFQVGYVSPAGGTITGDSIVMIGDLTANRFSYIVEQSSDIQITEVIVVVVNGSGYAFGYTYLASIKQTAQRERDAFFSSIKVADNVSAVNQTGQDGEFTAGEQTGRILRYTTIVLVLCAVMLWIYKKFRIVRIIKISLALAFIFFGLVNLILYIGNTLMETGSPYILVNFGYVYFIIGVALLFIRIPRETR